MLDAPALALVKNLQLEAERVDTITALPTSDGIRRTLRVTLRGGGSIKLRQERPYKLRRFSTLVQTLADPALPRVLAVSENLCIEEWIEGTSLSRIELREDHLVRAAEILGRLHSQKQLGARLIHRIVSTENVLLQTRRALGKLGTCALLSRSEIEAALAILRCDLPHRTEVGIGHFDLCAENLVVDAAGQLHAIDNEGLRLGFLDLDLARTWYRWPMSDAAWNLFVARYAAFRQPARQHMFWRVVALVRAAQRRLLRGSPVSAPLSRLRQLIAAAGADEIAAHTAGSS